ncbi:hypothetical protein HZH66_012685 [Vespula vulgaris]|uniref:Uncharacterized protein n=1 Tax=Vespula vulgaris TaxID=7454 RepID=A0A834MTA8_VESVU|nr:hypothetical protein HZH66_012685 [Vespula vulgaris]
MMLNFAKNEKSEEYGGSSHFNEIATGGKHRDSQCVWWSLPIVEEWFEANPRSVMAGCSGLASQQDLF